MDTFCPLTFVYWIHLPEHTDKRSQGYIGVTRTPEKRWKQHKDEANSNRHPNSHLSSAIKKYDSTLIYEIVLLSNSEYCYEYERILRPSPSIGWNLMSGGPVGKITEEGRKRLSEAAKAMWTDSFKLRRRHKLYQQKHGHITRAKFIELEHTSQKQIPPNEATLKIIDLATCEEYANIEEAANQTGIDKFEIYLATKEPDSFWVFTKMLE